MHDEPEDLPTDLVGAALQRHWGIEVAELEYAPVGFGSYHWRATGRDRRKWFVTADRLGQDAADREAAFSRLRSAYETASSLRSAGLEFVVAPVRDIEDQLLERIEPGWAIAAFEHIEGGAAGNGSWPAGSARRSAARVAARIHSAPPPRELQRFSFDLVQSAEIFHAADLPTGPYSEPAHELIHAHRSSMEALLARYDQLVDELKRDTTPWVVTHGELHSANFIVAVDGRLHLIDWDTVRLAPPERDLESLPIEEPDVLDAYVAAAGARPPRPYALELFEAWWVIHEVAEYADRFRHPHTDSLDSKVGWRDLENNLELAAAWPGVH